MKVQRWYVGPMNWHGSPDHFGKWCQTPDVAMLEAKHAKVVTDALDAVDWWDAHEWAIRDLIGSKESEKMSIIINRLRAAIAKAEGEGL